MIRIGVTGASGLLGWHFRCFMHGATGFDVHPAGRDIFEDASALASFVDRSDVIVHLAGVNRGDPELLERANELFARRLVDECTRSERRPHILYSNSIQAEGDSPYGRSKRRAGEILEDWATTAGATTTNILFPHVFGECGRPFHNSVVSTFCHQLAHGEQPSVNTGGVLELTHAQQAAATIAGAITNTDLGNVERVRVAGRKTTVGDLFADLRSFATSYGSGRIPRFSDGHSLALFNTYRSYLFPWHYPVPLEPRTDARGRLVEIVKEDNGGQTFISDTEPGVTRGEHFHRRKIERFVVVEGQAVIRIRRLHHGDVHEFKVEGQAPSFIDMPTMHTHDITNVGDRPLVTVFWASEVFDQSDPDTVPEPVVERTRAG